MNIKQRNYYLIILLLSITFIYASGQTSSRNGYYSSNTGTIRFFLVFAEAVGDPKYDRVYDGWPIGQMPLNPGYYFDHIFNSSDISGMVTRVYDQASFRNLTVIGDYFPNLVQINYTDIISGIGDTQVYNYLKNQQGNDINPTGALLQSVPDFITKP